MQGIDLCKNGVAGRCKGWKAFSDWLEQALVVFMSLNIIRRAP